MSSLIVEVCKVKKVRNHKNADRLDIIQVKGWNCIVGRDEHQVGDLVIFVPPDSILPKEIIDRWNISYLKGKRGRVGVVKLRGEYSEGLILPNDDGFKEGTNVANTYGITKWEPKQQQISKPRKRRRKSSIPEFRRFTDIENFKHFETIFGPGETVVITEKLHGSNFRVGNVYIKPTNIFGRIREHLFGKRYRFMYGSHNVILDINDDGHDYYDRNIYLEIVKKYRLDEIIPKGYVLYGEIIGPKVQDLTYGLDEIDVAFFDVFFNGEYVNVELTHYFLHTLFKLPMVPILYTGPWKTELIDEYACGKSALDNSTLREGIVIRPVQERTHKVLGRVILKAISKEYLTRKRGTEFH